MAEAESAAAAPIIVKKKKGGHGGHHGGAWKVAYADFVTAMMALFIVLWLMNSSSRVQKAVGGYFKDPSGVGKMVGTNLAGSGEGVQVTKNDLKDLKDKLESAFKQMPEFDQMKDNVEMLITAEGLRLELLETEKGLFFDSGSPAPSSAGTELLEKLAAELGKLNNRVLIEGHTDSRPFVSDRHYSNWELSADRANAARRVMQENGLRADQVTQVRGFADQRLRKKDAPEDNSNRRITVLIQNQEVEAKQAAASKETEKGGGHGAEAKGGEAKAGEHGAAASKPEEHGGEKKPEAHSGGGSPNAQQAPPPKSGEAPNKEVHH
jgi:chemotaxis protein MotB